LNAEKDDPEKVKSVDLTPFFSFVVALERRF
jgi:hypothetical protein